jgi:hypothetical protein
VHRLADEFKDRVDFIYLNIDRPETFEARQRFDIVARSQYVLIDAQGNLIQKWFGFLDEETVKAAIDDFLASG